MTNNWDARTWRLWTPSRAFCFAMEVLSVYWQWIKSLYKICEWDLLRDSIWTLRCVLDCKNEWIRRKQDRTKDRIWLEIWFIITSTFSLMLFATLIYNTIQGSRIQNLSNKTGQFSSFQARLVHWRRMQQVLSHFAHLSIDWTKQHSPSDLEISKRQAEVSMSVPSLWHFSLHRVPTADVIE